VSRTAPPVTEASARTARGQLPLRQRIALLDVTRGLLVLLMTNTHALTLSKVRVDSFWRSAYWLPHGWATTCFILLSGFTLGVLVPGQGSQVRTWTTVRRRSRDLLVVMFVSNILFLALHHLATGTLYTLWHWHWWLGLVTFDTPYSISAILLPTGVLLLLAPSLCALEAAHPRLFAPGGVLVTGAVAWSQRLTAAHPLPHLLALLLHGERLGVPVLLLLTYGGLGIAAGRCSRRFPTRRVWLALLGVTGFALLGLLHRGYPRSGVVDVLDASLLPPTQLAVVLSVAWLLLHLRWQGLAGCFRLLGVYALFAFIVHRILLQSLNMGLNVLAMKEGGCRYGLLVTSTMLLTCGLCWWRQRQAGSGDVRAQTQHAMTANMPAPSLSLVSS
jgi:hypothetical protein